MTANTSNIALPQAGAQQAVELPNENGASLGFGANDIDGFIINEGGNLVINFENGGSLVVSNFQELAGSNATFSLSDGGVLDTAQLNDQLGGEAASTSGSTESGSLFVGIPEAGATEEIDLQNGQNYVLDFDPAQAKEASLNDNQMTIRFENGSEVVLNNVNDASEFGIRDENNIVNAQELLAGIGLASNMPEEELLEETEEEEVVARSEIEDVMLQSGDAIGAGDETGLGYDAPEAEEESLTAEELNAAELNAIQTASGENLQSIAQRLAQVEPAAGDAASSRNSGFTFNDPDNVPLQGVGAIGPLGETALNYQIPTFPEDIFIEEEIQAAPASVPPATPLTLNPATDSLDETDLGPIVKEGGIPVSFGNDEPGTVTPDDCHEVEGSLLNDTLSSNGVAIEIITTSTGYEGFAGQTKVFEFNIVEGDNNNFSYSFTLLEPLDHADGTDANDEITLKFGIVAENSEGEEVKTKVEITVADDAPFSTASSSSAVDETDLTNGPIDEFGTINVDFGNDGPGSISENGNFNASGSLLNGQLTSGGETITVTQTNNGYVGTIGSGNTLETVFELKITGVTYTFTQYKTLDHADGSDKNDKITLDFGITTTDFDGDTSESSIIVTVADDAPPAANPAFETVNEENLGPITETGVLNSQFGEDGAGSIESNGSFSATGSTLNGQLTSNNVGVVVTVKNDGTGYEGFAGQTKVFELTITDPETGAYSFTQYAPLDHELQNPNNPADDAIILNFGVTVQDYDGDSVQTNIQVNIIDGQPTINEGEEPEIGAGYEITDEENLSPVVKTGQVDVTFNGDTGVVKGDDSFSSTGSKLNGQLTSNGVAVTYELSGNTYTLKAGNTVVATLEIQDNGTYTFTLLEQFDHNVSGEDVITLNFGIVAEDSDGDTDSGTIRIDVIDDIVIANDDSNTVQESTGSIGGNVLDNDDLSQDDANTVTDIRFGNNTQTVNGNGTTTISGLYGDLEIAADGTYTYTLTTNNPPAAQEVFTYTLTDFDGDSDNATLTIDISNIDNQPVLTQPVTETVEEGNLDPTLVEEGTLEANFFGEGPGTFEAVDSFVAGGELANGALTFNGEAVTHELVGNTHVLKTANKTIAELTINSNGTYTYTQYDNFDHADTNDTDEIITLTFGVQAKDVDGDTDQGTITINVKDDAPVAEDDSQTLDESQTNSVGGNALDNDDLSTDGENTVTSIAFNGNTQAVSGNTATTISGLYGDLEIAADGTYTYTLTSNNPPATQEVFTYTLTDFDGDSEPANITITINNIDNQPELDAVTETVDETDLNDGLSTVDVTGDLVANFGNEGPGTYQLLNGVTAGGELLNGQLTHNGQPIVTTLEGNNYYGRVGNKDIFKLNLEADGSYEFKLFDNLDHADPDADNEIISLQFNVQATDADGDTVQSTLTINVQDDVPFAENDTGTVEESTGSVGGNVLANDDLGEDQDSTVTNIKFGNNGSVVNGNGATTISGLYGDLEIAADGTYTYTLTANNPPAAQEVFTYTLTDFDGDSSDATLTITIDNIDNEPVLLQPVVETVDETDLNDGLSTVSVDGDLQGEFFGEGVGTYRPTDSFSASGELLNNALTHNGQPVVVALEGNNYYGRVGNKDIFKLNVELDGSYEFKLFDNLDHADPDADNEIITLSFGVEAVDIDGDTDQGFITINVKDDVPSISEKFVVVDEDSLSGGSTITVNDTLNNVDFGEDGAGRIEVTTGSKQFETLAEVGGQPVALRSAGQLVTVTQTQNGYVGKLADDTTVFDLTITNDQTGAYEYNQYLPVDHPSQGEDILWLKFYVDIVDFDGDRDTTVIGIDVRDSVPVAEDDINTFSGDSADGNVLSGTNGGAGAEDTLSEDKPTTVTFVNGQAVAAQGTTTVQGTYGTLNIESDGSYTYAIDPNVVTTTEEFAFTPVASDIQNNRVSGENGFFTIRAINPNNDADKTLTFVNEPEPGFAGGLGVAGNGSDKANSGFDFQEGIEVKFSEGVDEVTLLIGDIGGNNTNSAIDLRVYFEGSNTPQVFELQTPNQEPDQGLFEIILNASDFGNDLKISEVEILSQYDIGNLNPTSFLLNSVSASVEGNDEIVTDVFEYTITDADGDTSTANLVLNNGGGQSVAGTLGNDILAGTNGNDVLFGDEGGDSLFGGDGRDTFLFLSTDEGADTITDFTIGKDKIDVSELLELPTTNPVQVSIDDFISVSNENGNTTISVDRDGTGNAATAQEIATLEGVSKTLQELVDTGSLVA